MNNYRIIDNLNKKKYSNDHQTYLIYDQKDKSKTKYILRLIELENLSNLTEFIVCQKHNLNHYFSSIYIYIERYFMV
jgi:hypothetical protein